MSIPVTISKVLAVAVANVAWVRRLRNAVIGIVAMAAIGAGAVVATAIPALACTPAPGGGCYTPNTYYVSGTDGRLAMESAPAPGHFVSWIGEGQPVQVVCQVNFGKQTDGRSSHTWDYIVGNEWVYDSYVTTPAQDAYGWSSGLPRCGLPATGLATSVSVPNLAIDSIQAVSSPKYVFKDGPGFFNAAVVNPFSSAGACQDLVMANSDFWWLWDSWDGYVTLNNVFTWAAVSKAYGRTVSSTPKVGDIVVFNGGWHRPWDYGTGHVAVVVKVNDSSSFTIAEFNWHAGGGGYHIMDYRRVPMNVGAVSAFIR